MTVVMFTSITEGFLIGRIHYPTESPYQCKGQKVDKVFNKLLHFFLMFKNTNIRPNIDP